MVDVLVRTDSRDVPRRRGQHHRVSMEGAMSESLDLAARAERIYAIKQCSCDTTATLEEDEAAMREELARIESELRTAVVEAKAEADTMWMCHETEAIKKAVAEAVEKEREACATVCERPIIPDPVLPGTPSTLNNSESFWNGVHAGLAKIIRVRGTAGTKSRNKKKEITP